MSAAPPEGWCVCGHDAQTHQLLGCNGAITGLAGAEPCDCEGFEQRPAQGIETPVLPYQNPVPNSGWSGSETSRDRALRRDVSGKTKTLQNRMLVMLAQAGERGVTVHDGREATGEHHGSVSAALSNLHKAGKIARVDESRDRCKVYVLPDAVGGRRTEPQGRRG